MTKNTKILTSIIGILLGAVLLLGFVSYSKHTTLKDQEGLNVELREKSANDSILIKDLQNEKDTLESQRQERADMAEKRFELMKQKDKQLEEKDAQIEQLNKDLQAKRERQEAERKAAEVQKQKQVAQAKTTAPSQSGGAVSSSPVVISRGEGEPSGGREFYVEATAYGPDCVGCSGITATGINVGANPHMKLIAVDPNVIPLGSKVWVEGYGYAIAGDTGGDIKGNRIDVLYPSEAAAYSWGRRTVKIRVLN